MADSETFNFIDEEEVKKTIKLLEKERVDTMDFFCAIRYYKCDAEKKKALKFDYYLLRTIYNQETLEIQVYHKKGPRYLSPEDLTLFIFDKTNEASNKKVLRLTSE